LGDATLNLLLGVTLTTALFHTLIPDHWLPFVLIGRSREWTAGYTAAVSGLSSLIHTVLSLGLGLLALWAGLEAAHAIGENLERAGSVLLILFGLGYAAWAWRKGGHFHPGGRLLHRTAEAEPCHGDEGEHPEHLHYHADGDLIHGTRDRSALWLAFVVGVNPCILILPLFLATAERGAAAVLAVSLTYSAATIALMVGLSTLGVTATHLIRVPGIARHMEWISGLLIAATGVVFWLLDSH
jgi:nickel/cobalt transporter (NicO) family protein